MSRIILAAFTAAALMIQLANPAAAEPQDIGHGGR